MLAHIYFEMGEDEKANELIKKSETKNNNLKSPLYLIKAYSYLRAKKYKKTLKNIKKVIDNNFFGEKLYFWDQHIRLKATALFRLEKI